MKRNRIRKFLRVIGDIFIPLLPGIIAAGLCGGFASLIAQAVPNYTDNTIWAFLYQILTLINTAMMSFLTAWAGYRAAERFGGTPILGGMLGMITSLEGINKIAAIMGLYNSAVPLDSVLSSGKGGVLAVIVGALLIAYVEKTIRSIMPDSIDIVFTPLLTMFFCVIPYIVFIMPLFGYASGGIVWLFSRACLSENLLIRALSGYFAAAFFLPLVAAGMHHGLVALYSVQLQELGYITLYPALAMAGAGQVGAALALWKKARKVGNDNLCSVISGALPAGLLGVGEPLIYGVTLPLGRPFLTAASSRDWLAAHGLARLPVVHVDKYGREPPAAPGAPRALTLAEFAARHYDFAVEDSPAALAHLAKMEGCLTAVFARPWNTRTPLPSDAFVRCADWGEVDALLRERRKMI